MNKDSSPGQTQKLKRTHTTVTSQEAQRQTSESIIVRELVAGRCDLPSPSTGVLYLKQKNYNHHGCQFIKQEVITKELSKENSYLQEHIEQNIEKTCRILRVLFPSCHRIRSFRGWIFISLAGRGYNISSCFNGSTSF